MPKRCADTHFYVAGHKTRSGCARYTSPDGSELEVVCGRNRPGPGQIHLRDVPDGTELAVTGRAGTLTLPLDQATTRGRAGRLRLDALDAVSRSRIVANNVAELPAHHADYRWASAQVGFWVDHVVAGPGAGAETTGPGGSASIRNALRRGNAHRYVDQGTWERLVWSGERGSYGPTRAYLARLCGQVSGMDPIRDRRAFDTALRELIALSSALPGDIPPQYLDRLATVLVAEAPRLGLPTLERLAVSAAPAFSLDLVSRMVATHGVANATATRALGHQLLEGLLSDNELSPPERRWLHFGILADERLARFHNQAVLSTESLPDELVPAAYKLACPAAAKLLATLRPGAMVPDPASERAGAEAFAKRCAAEKVPSAHLRFCPIVPVAGGFPASPRPTADRVAMASGVSREEKLDLLVWDEALYSPRLRERMATGQEWIGEYVGCGVTSFPAIARLARNGIMPWELDVLDEAGARTPSQKIACSIRDVHAGELETFRERGVIDLSEALRLTRHRVTAYCILGYEALDIHDRAVMVRLGDLGVSPAGLAAFRAAGRTLDEVFDQAAHGVSGMECLALTGAGVDDPAVQARLCRVARAHEGPRHREHLNFMSAAGVRGDDLVAAIDRGLDWVTVEDVVYRGVDFAELLKGLDAGVAQDEIGEYCAAGVHSSREWAVLSAAKVSAAKVEYLRLAGVETAEEMVPYAAAPISNPQDAIDCVAAHARAKTPTTRTAEALL